MSMTESAAGVPREAGIVGKMTAVTVPIPVNIGETKAEARPDVGVRRIRIVAGVRIIISIAIWAGVDNATAQYKT